MVFGVFNRASRQRANAERQEHHKLASGVARRMDNLLSETAGKSIFTMRHGTETNPGREERDVLRISRPLKGIKSKKGDNKLLTHQGIWLRDKQGSGPAFSFVNSGRRKARGLKMDIEYTPDARMDGDWRLDKAEWAGTSTASDGDAYNSCKYRLQE